MIVRALALLGLALLAQPGSSEERILTVREGTNFSAAVSPGDGSFLLDLQGTLWRLPAEGGVATALTDGLGDDRLPHVAGADLPAVFQSYRNGTWDLWSLEEDGAVALTDTRYDDREPVLSPDGARVAFSSDRGGSYDVWILALESGEVSPLTSGEAEEFMPAWSPDGTRVVYVTETADGGFALREKSADDPASEARTIASFDSPIASPAYSPSGERISLRALVIGDTSADANGMAPTATRLVLVDVETGTPVDVEAVPDLFPFRASWIDDDTVVYTGAGGLWRQSLSDGAEPERVPFEIELKLDRPEYERRAPELPESGEEYPVKGIVHPVTSPDGGSIVYAALGDLWLVDRDGGTPKALTRDEHLDTDPEWSPDGRSLVYSSDRFGSMDLWVRAVDAPPRSMGQRITEAAGAELAPDWSPDGASIAYLDESSRLHVLELESGTDRVLTPPRRGVGQPSWSSDSRHVALSIHEPRSTRFREGYNRIVIVDTFDGTSRVLEQPERSISGRDGEGPVWSPDGNKLAFAMDGGVWVLPVTPDGRLDGTARQVAADAADFTSWTPEGELVYVTPRGIRRVDGDDGSGSYLDLDHRYEIGTPSGRLVLRNVRVFDGTGAPIRDGMDVTLNGNRIETIAPTSDVEPEDVRTVDGAGRTLIPGLIEMHTHLSLPAFGSEHGKVWLAYGITSMRTPADTPYRVLEERESIRSGRRIGPRVFFTGGTMDGDRVYYSGGLAIGDEEELAQEVQRAFDLGYDVVKTYVRLPDDYQKLVIEEAHRQGVPVTSHEIYPAIAYGVDGLEHVAGTSRRGFSPKFTDLRRSYDDVLQLVASSGVFFTPTILIYGGYSLALAQEPDLLDERRFTLLYPAWAQERFRQGPKASDPAGSRAVMEPIFETVKELGERGARLVAGTDSPIIPYGLSLILEIEQLSDAGLGPSLALQSATRVAAEALGAEDLLGTIEEGKVADLVLLDGDPLEDIRNLRRAEIVIVNGRILAVEQLIRSR